MSARGRGGSKRNVAFIQGEEPKFLQEFKQRAGYMAGPALEEKFLGGKIPRDHRDDGEDSQGSGSDDNGNTKKAGRNRRGFSPTERFGKVDKRSASPEDRSDEEPLVVKLTADGKSHIGEESTGTTAPPVFKKRKRPEDSHMPNATGTEEEEEEPSKVWSGPAPAAKESSDTVDVEKLVAAGGKFLFKKPPTTEDSTPDNSSKQATEYAPESSQSKRWRQDGVFKNQFQASSDSKSTGPLGKKKSESRAVRDRTLLSFDTYDD